MAAHMAWGRWEWRPRSQRGATVAASGELQVGGRDPGAAAARRRGGAAADSEVVVRGHAGGGASLSER